MMLSVKDENGKTYDLDESIGEGGQGCVFTVLGEESVVIKAIVDENNDIVQDEKTYKEFKKKIRKVMALGEFKNVALPYVMLEKPNCGYVMLFMSGMFPIAKIMLPYVFKNKASKLLYIPNDLSKSIDHVIAKNQEEFIFSYHIFADLKKRLRCLINLAMILVDFELHNVVYCDLSPNNIFISKNHDDYEVWLIDLDNLSFQSEIKSAIGTPKYMAPEVTKGNPNTIYSDRYSFAIIAYQCLMLKNPFLGKLEENYSSWDEDDNDFEQAISQGEVPWIWEKGDDSNRDEHSLNPQSFLTEELYDLFENTLNKKGRNHPTSRPSMQNWLESLINAYESLMLRKVRFSEETFKALFNHGKSYEQDVYLLTDNFFFGQKMEKYQLLKSNSKRIKVTIYSVQLLEDEETTKSIGMFNKIDKIIYWEKGEDQDEFALSNFDILTTHRKEYISNYIEFIKKQGDFSRKTEYYVLCKDNNIQIIFRKNGNVITFIEDLFQCEIYIQQHNRLINKIIFEEE